MPRLTRRALAACLAVSVLLPAQAMAQTFPVKLMGFSAQNLRGGPIAIPAYQVAFITSQQGTASGGVMTKSRLTTSLANVPEDVMQRLTDEAYADLKAQFAAAGIAMVDEKAVQDAVAATGAERFDSEITRIGPGVTIGAGVKKSYAAFGAKGARGIKGIHAPASPSGVSAGLGMLAINNKLGPVAKAQKSILVMPSLVIDFGQTSAAAGRDFLNRETAGVNSKLGFSLSMVSGVSLLTTMSDGRFITPGMMRMPPKDLTVSTPFATVATGEGAVRALSVATVVDSNYIKQDTARGDAVVVDLPVWEGLVRQAFKDFNAAIVAEFKKVQK